MATRTSIGAFTSSAAAVTVPFGVGANAGDVGWMLVETANEAVPALTNWPSIFSSIGFGTAGAAGASRLTILRRIGITAGEITSGLALGDSGDHQNAVLITGSGIDPTTPEYITSNSQSAVANTTPATGSLTGAVSPGDVCLGIVATDRDSGTVSSNAAANWANLSGSNSFILNGSSAKGFGGGLIINEIVPTDVVGGIQFSCSITSSAWTAVILVLNGLPSIVPVLSPSPMLPLLCR